MDAIDVALLETDGENLVKPGASTAVPYCADDRVLLRKAIDDAATWKAGTPPPASVVDAEMFVTKAHAKAVIDFLKVNRLTAADVDLIGFHGQTVLHQPEQRRTVQIGMGQKLADMTGIDVVYDFRSADVAAGGEGAPFASLYHKALATSLGYELPVAVLNLGGVGNVTWLGPDDAILAFDTGPANGLIDDWVYEAGAGRMDEGGKIAARGKIDEAVLAAMLSHDFFEVTPPKSLDRLDFALTPMRNLNLEDGAATLTAFTSACVARAREHMSVVPTRWIVCGGGRKNPVLMKMLSERLGVPVEAAEGVGWRGDDMEAEAFAYLAVRSRRGLPLSVPGTTGVPEPQKGGRFCSTTGS